MSIISHTSHQQTPDNCRCINGYLDRKPKLKLQSQTTNKAFYKTNPIEKQVIPEMPKVVQKHYDQSVLQSSYKSQYKQPQKTTNQLADNLASSSSNMINSYMNRKPDLPFYSDTQYKNSFKEKPVQVEKQPKYQYQPKNVKFQGQSSYKAQFVQKKPELANVGQNIVTTSDYLNRKPKIPFEGSSSYKATFTKYDVKPEKQPDYKYSKNTTKFEGSSSYKDTFKMPPKQAFKTDLQYCPIHPSKIAMK